MREGKPDQKAFEESDSQLIERQSERADEAARRLGALGGGAKHQSLVDVAESVDLVVSEMKSLLELDADGIQVPDVANGTVEDRDLASLLGGGGKVLLEASVAITELVAAALFRLDALLADGLATGLIGAVGRCVEVLVVVLIVTEGSRRLLSSLASAGALLVLQDRSRSSRCSDGVEAS